MLRDSLPRSKNSPARVGWREALLWLRHYWSAWVLGIVGLASTAVFGRKMDQWAVERDGERFTGECRALVAMIEQKMERYETALSRLRDAFAADHGRISGANWSGWINHVVQMADNYPNVRVLLVAPKISRADSEMIEDRLIVQDLGFSRTINTTRPDAEHWAPVWQRSVRDGISAPNTGDDLLAEGPGHLSLEPALAATFGWVTEQPSRLSSLEKGEVTGFWFVLPLRPTEFKKTIPWQNPSESPKDAAQRRKAERAQQATGLLAAFLAGNSFMEQFNRKEALVRVQLFTSKDPDDATLLNPGQPAPANARFIQDHLMPWYGNRWTARFHSTPIFEAGSLRYRGELVWWLGIPLSLAGAGALAWQIRGRQREAALAEELRKALSRQERLSRDLHDGTLQSVYGLGLGLQRAQRLLKVVHPDETARQLADITPAVQRVIGELREFIRATDSSDREDVPLGEALAGVVDHLKFATDMELRLEVAPGADLGLVPAQSLQLLNIAREALSNSIRHSHAQRVRITVTQSAGVISMEISDDGRGFDPQAQSAGRGLQNLEARVRELGGSYHWDAAPGRGARLTVQVPLVNFSSATPHEK
jgi:signal transduction histidine kinase